MVIIQTYLRVKRRTSTGKSHIPALNERNRIKSLVIFSYFCLTYFYDLPVIDMESMKGYLSKHVSLSSHSNALKKELLLSSSRAIACRGVACSVFNDEMPAARRFDFQLTDKWKAPAFCDKLNSFPPSSICTAVCAICNDNDVREPHSKWFRQKTTIECIDQQYCRNDSSTVLHICKCISEYEMEHGDWSPHLIRNSISAITICT